MKKALIVLVLPLLALAGTVTKTIGFDSRDLEVAKANGYDVLKLADFVTTLELGEPMMPQATFHVLVPANATVTSIKATRLQPEEIPGTFLVHPVQQPVTVSATEMPEFVEPDPEVYASSTPYPAETAAWNRTGTKAGYRLCPFVLHPLTWTPATGKLTLYRRIEVTVTYVENDVTPTPLTRGQQDLFGYDVSGMVLNPGDLARFSPPVRETDNPDVDYAIITSTSFENQFDDLVDWRTRRGYRAEVFTTTWINSNYPSGRDQQERIRDFIIDYFNNHGLKFVLLAGDHSIVPGRRCRARVNNSDGNIPADCYYGDLQWSYDGNNNNVFGEAGYDTVDFYYDVYVGRASVDNTSQCQTFVSKVLAYEKNPTTDYLKKMCLPYVDLWSGYSGKLCNDSIAAQTPSGWTDFYIADPTSTTPMRNAINSGYHFCHPTAHGNATGLYDMQGRTIYSTSVAGGQTNSTRPTIMNSIACISGNFEYSDCLAEALMNNSGGGAVAVMMNSREGWGTPPSMGPSEKIDNKFYDFYFRRDSLDIGVTHARSKDFYVYQAQSQGVWRWCYWDLNLFGDPNMALWKDTPGTLAADQPDTVETGAQTLQFNITSGGSAVEGALVCLHKGDEVHVTGRTNWNGQVSLQFNPLTPGMMYFTVTAKSKYPLEDTIVVVPGAPQPYISYQGHFIDDGNNRLDPGETVNLYVTVKNMGNATASNVQGVLRTASGYITMTDSTSSYGSIPDGDTARGDAYVVTASGGTPGGTRINFTVHVTSDEGSWDPTFELVVGSPPTPGAVVMNHDTGYCKLTVSCLGGIGFTEPPALDLGSGFSYPKASASQLFYSSFLLGNGASYIADRFYSQPASSGVNEDFGIVDSLRPVVPPGSGDEHFRCVMDDGGHPSSKDIQVTQHSHMCADPGYDDFIILAYDIKNNGGSAVNGLYAGIASDFDIGSDPTTNTAFSNEAKRFSYMRQSSSANPSVGMKILDPPSFANLTAVDHARYVYPDSCVTDNQKYRILNGEISLRNSNRPYDWSVAVSAGPFDLPAGATQRVAFAYLGGNSAASFEENADSAQSWYDNNAAVFEPPEPRPREQAGITCSPNPFTRAVNVRCQVPVAGRVKVEVFDISGRTVATLLDGDVAAGRINTEWKPGEVANGVYLVKVSLSGSTLTEKLMLLR